MGIAAAEGVTFTDAEAPGAWRNGSRVRKVSGDAGDVLTIGTLGRVLGSLGPIDPPEMGSRYGYFVEWDGWKACIFFVRSAKLALEPVS